MNKFFDPAIVRIISVRCCSTLTDFSIVYLYIYIPLLLEPSFAIVIDCELSDQAGGTLAFCIGFTLNADSGSATCLAGVDVAPVSDIENVIFWFDCKPAEAGVFKTDFRLSEFKDCVFVGVDSDASFPSGDILNSLAAVLSAIVCGVAQISTCVGSIFSMLNDNRSPCVDRI